MKIPTYEEILQAYDRIKTFVHRTPVFQSSSINSIVGGDIFFKCENLQKVGAFKFRGATNAVLSLSNEETNKGVTTHSSGNHAAAVCLAAKMLNIPAHIIMPKTAPEIKKKAVEGYGAKITFCNPTLESREAALKIVQERTGATFIHPFDNYNVICGQGTAVKELLEEIPDLDIIVTPIGGGGLLSGTSIAAKEIKPGIKVYGGEPKNADDAYRSFKDGKLYPPLEPNTIADGLLTSLSPLTLHIIRKNVDDIFTVEEDEIVSAMRMVWERMKIIIEPSSAVPVAAIIKHPEVFKHKNIGVIISGGNVDLEKLPF